MSEQDKVNQRLENLQDVLKFCTDVEQTFTVWERMAINQERGTLLEYLGENPTIRNYKVPDRIEGIVKATLSKIKNNKDK